MASGDLLAAWIAGANDYPASGRAQLSRDVDYGYFLVYPDDADAGAIFQGILGPSYAGGGLTVEFVYLMSEANTSDAAVLGAAIQSLADGADVSGTVSWAENTATVTVPDDAEEIDVKSVTFTDGADMASIAAGDPFRIRIRRLGANVADTAAGELRLLAVRVKET